MTTHILERRKQLTGGGEPPALQDWRNMLKHAQELRLKLRNQRTARCSAPARAEERQEESCETLREKREALRQRRIRTSDIRRLAVTVESGTEQKPGQNVTEKKKRSSARLNIVLFFYRKQFIQLKPLRAMISELSDRIWGRLGLSAVRAVPLEEPRAPSRGRCGRTAPAWGRLDPRAPAAPSSWAAGLHHRRRAAAGAARAW